MQINPKEVVRRKIISNFANEEDQVQQNGIDLTNKDFMKIKNGEWCNFEYTEQFDMQDTFGLIRIRSSLARKGFILQSGVFDSGFKGKGGCVLHNFTGKDQVFAAGFRVGQMIVFKGDAASMYDGHYQNSDSIESKYGEDKK